MKASFFFIIGSVSCVYGLLTNGDAYEAYLTTGDQAKKLSRQAIVPTAPNSQGYSVWVDRRKRRQTIDGFGAAMTNSAAYVIYNSPQRNQIMQDLFDQNGLAISYVRMTMGASDFMAVHPYTYADTWNDYDLQHFSIDKDLAFFIPILRQAVSINPHLKIMATPWSAPAWMKGNGNLNGGNLNGNDRVYRTYANYFLKFIQAYATHGIRIESLTVQNEPQYETSEYPSMKMSPDQQRTFIKDYLGPLFKQRGITTKILVWDHNWDGTWFVDSVLSDSAINQYVAGVAWHGYSGRHDEPETYHNKHPNFGMYFTEISGGQWDSNFASILTWDTRIITIGQTRSWAKSVLFWNLALDDNHGPKKDVGGCSDCRGVITVHTGGGYTFNAEYYALAHFSKFVKPGAVRLESNFVSWDDLQTAAFVNPDGTTAVIVQNPNSGKSASFSLDIDAKHYHYNNLPPQSKDVGGCSDCRGVITVHTGGGYTFNAEYYALAHFSKFVKPGAVRLESNFVSWDDLQTAAFVNPDGTTAVIVQNPNSGKSASFSLDIDAKHYHYNNLPLQSVITFIK